MLGVFFDLSGSDVASTTYYAGGLIKDFWPILATLIGVMIAGMIFSYFFRR